MNLQPPCQKASFPKSKKTWYRQHTLNGPYSELPGPILISVGILKSWISLLFIPIFFRASPEHPDRSIHDFRSMQMRSHEGLERHPRRFLSMFWVIPIHFVSLRLFSTWFYNSGLQISIWIDPRQGLAVCRNRQNNSNAQSTASALRTAAMMASNVQRSLRKIFKDIRIDIWMTSR